MQKMRSRGFRPLKERGSSLEGSESCLNGMPVLSSSGQATKSRGLTNDKVNTSLDCILPFAQCTIQNHRRMQIQPIMFTCALLSLCLAISEARNLIVHAQTLEKTCSIDMEDVKNNATQLKICQDWTNGQPINNWIMSDWVPIMSSDDPILQEYSMNLVIKTINADDQSEEINPVFVTRISYDTTVQLPYILKKITGLHPSMTVKKIIFLHRGILYSNIQIDNIPILSYITIKNKISLSSPGKDNVVSKHFISHGEIPFFAKWTTNILKAEIIKSLDRYDEISLEKYCLKL